MSVINEKNRTNTIDPFSNFVSQPTNTRANDDLILNEPVGGSRSMLGMKITKVKFLGKEYYLKANRYLLLIVLTYLVENDMIDLIEELPLKNISTNKRCLINYRPFHADDYKMKDIIYLNTEGGCLYMETKLDTPTIHDASYKLLRRYKIPVENLEVQYSKKRRKVPPEYVMELKRQGYCPVDDSSISDSQHNRELQECQIN